MADRHGNPPRAWQRMLSGRRLDLLDPSPLDVELADIAHGLARVARWNGQTVGPHAFSVAQHCLVVLDLALRLEPALSPADRLTIVLHDAPEYVIGDMISPFKAVMGGQYRDVEARLTAAIHRRFGLPPVASAALHKLTKRADTISAYYEARELAGFSEAEAVKVFGRPRGFPATLDLVAWPTAEAEDRFVAACDALARAVASA